MSENWKQAKRELRAAGIKVNTSLKGCCLGCLENSPFPDDAPAIYQLSSRWDSHYGGYLCHQNITPERAELVQLILKANLIRTDWDGTRAHSIFIDLAGFDCEGCGNYSNEYTAPLCRACDRAKYRAEREAERAAAEAIRAAEIAARHAADAAWLKSYYAGVN